MAGCSRFARWIDRPGSGCRRTGDLSGSAGQGLFVTWDGGQDWQVSGLPITAFVHGPAVRQRLVLALADGALYRSTDRGRTWEPEPTLPQLRPLAFTVGPAGRLYLGTHRKGVAMRGANGRWQIGGPSLRGTEITSLVAHPTRLGVAYLGTRLHGIHKTTDGGRTWALTSQDIGRQVVTALAQDPINANVFYAGAVDGVYRSQDGGWHWALVSRSLGQRYVLVLAVDPVAGRDEDGHSGNANRGTKRHATVLRGH